MAATAHVDGDIIFDGSYYVLPVYSDGGGLTLPSRGHDTNVPSMLDMNIRRSIWAFPLGFVPESGNLNVEIDVKATICSQSTYWWTFVTAGPNPEAGEDSSRSFFQIHKPIGLVASYQIMFCPNNNDCRNIGVVVEEYGVPRLALSSMTFSFYFGKATEISSNKRVIVIKEMLCKLIITHDQKKNQWDKTMDKEKEYNT
uniref:Uncharacterized protein n=1 Tax=Brassica oleracea TaxID=3712 RepID=A0A3P6D5P7_BRAOL|nr:unnamed protein product [Brassica oleracea]